MKSPQKPVTKPDKYRRLHERLYEQNRDMVSREGYEKATGDAVHFKALVNKLTDLYQRIGRKLLLKHKNYHVWERQFERQRILGVSWY